MTGKRMRTSQKANKLWDEGVLGWNMVSRQSLCINALIDAVAGIDIFS